MSRKITLDFLKTEAASGIILALAAALAIILANSPWSASYFGLIKHPLTFQVGDIEITKTVLKWIKDGLMTIFFFVVGLEIKREIAVGQLSTRKRLALPLVAALGGMLVPALIYLGVSRGTFAAGWGVPMATDIAFALGIVALLGDRVPSALRIFLAALAIADDIGAVLVIAIFYTPSVATIALAATVAIMSALLWLNKRGVQSVWPYVAGGLLLWVAVYQSGVHASIAGVLLAVTIPSRGADCVQHKLEQALAKPVNFGIVPLFALANAGVTLPADMAAFATQPAVTATALGLIVGKPLGIFGAAWLAVKVRWAELPADSTFDGLFGVAVLGGIGFTMALFIAGLAFGESTQLDAAKIGVLSGSLITGIVGSLLLAFRARRSTRTAAAPVG